MIFICRSCKEVVDVQPAERLLEPLREIQDKRLRELIKHRLNRMCLECNIANLIDEKAKEIEI